MQDNVGDTPLHKAAFKDNVEVAKLLLGTEEGRKTIGMQNKAGQTPLHKAASNNRVEVAKLLLGTEEGRKAVVMQNNDGNTPLHLAVFEDNVEVAKLLLGEGCSGLLDIKNHEGNTARQCAPKAGSFGKSMVKRYIDSPAWRQAFAAKKKAEEEWRTSGGATDTMREEEERRAAAAKRDEEERRAVAAAKKEEEERRAAAAKKEEERRRAAAAAAAKKEEEERRATAAKKEEEEERRAAAAAAAAKKEEEEERRAAAAKKEEEERRAAAAAAAKREEEERKAAAAAAAMESSMHIKTLQPTGKTIKGICGNCCQPVYGSQNRNKTPEGSYIHVMADGTVGCPSPPGMGTFNVPTLQNDPVPQPAAAQYDQGVNYPPPASPTLVGGLQDMSLGGSGSPGGGRPPTLASSNFKKLYHKSELLDSPTELLSQVRDFLILHCRKLGLGNHFARELFKLLEAEAFKSVPSYGVDNVLEMGYLARYLWTSDSKLGVRIVDGGARIDTTVPKKHRREFCFILNSALRSDDAELLSLIEPLISAINTLQVVRRINIGANVAEMIYPKVGESGMWELYRGGGITDEGIDFFESLVDKTFRVPGFLATSTERNVAFKFMCFADDYDLIGVFYTISLDPRGKDDPRYRCKNVNYVERSKVADKAGKVLEAEYLFTQYSAFSVQKVERGYADSPYHMVYLEAKLDSRFVPEDVPTCPFI